MHRRNVEPDVLAAIQKFPENLEARSAVDTLRNQVCDLFSEFGAVHYQIGKYYPYLATRTPAARELLQTLKELLDPDSRINPGQLGLGLGSR